MIKLSQDPNHVQAVQSAPLESQMSPRAEAQRGMTLLPAMESQVNSRVTGPRTGAVSHPRFK